ncbi:MULTISPECIES: hypothetical protein [Metabacillus]|uniref:Uncharacterized protein n=2 Tax=Metabacillus TaxID=2675233 RepID=A0A179SN99_9BACI|nr:MULTISPECIES: hypothetical protein [Metabacillus]OAS83206.1 hypothetical protein A6K24_08790 [Metabacillus litoralis]QNF29675.1 hypothetical protein HUW50_20600 [Metabacillus sp. KUDC1714]
MVKLYDAKNIDSIEWSTKKDGHLIRNYFEILMKDGINKYIENIETEIYLLEIDDIILPISLNQKEFTNSYVVSPYTHYISYAKEELWELGNKRLEAFLSYIIEGIGFFLRKSNINKVVVVNNWLLSTNLYPSLTSDQIKKMTEFLTNHFPQHTILMRSINETLHNQMISSFNSEGYKRIMSRSIYLFDPSIPLTKKQRKALNQDKKLLEKFNYQIRDIQSGDFQKVEELYNQLYIDKYSINNPQFTEHFFKNAAIHNTIQFKLVLKEAKVIGVIGYFVRGGVLTTPILGYEIKREKEAGLYRVLSMLITKEIIDKNYMGHRSAGAGSFKRKRGSVQEIEYTYYYNKHLSFKSMLAWNSLKMIMDNVIEPLARKMRF